MMLGFKKLATAFDVPTIIPPPSRISVRPATDADLRAILAVEYGGDPVDPYDECCVRRLLQTPGLDCCVGKIGFAIVGWGLGANGREEGLYEIGNVVVLPGFRRRGVGRAILGHLCHSAYRGDVDAAKYLTVRATLTERNTAGLCFLRDCGFAEPVILRDWFDKDEHAVHQFYRPSI